MDFPKILGLARTSTRKNPDWRSAKASEKLAVLNGAADI
jgi:hypothetical protein